MALKTISESPTITDSILFEILTPDADGCFLSDPYKVEKVVIYYIQRDFFSNNYAEYNVDLVNENLLKELEIAKSAACTSPTAENLAEVNRIQNEIEKSKLTEKLNYNSALPVAIYGNENYPAWLSTDVDNAYITHVTTDEDGGTIYGNFKLIWEPLGQREGDYVITWSWKPNAGGDYLYESKTFSLLGNTQITTSIPTHFTDPTKYETLLERYLPSMFKLFISQSDLTPTVLQEFNKSVAKGFTFLEDMANQTVDLIDANSTHESLLPLLGNLFNLKLRTNDPTLWRRQIKRAIPLFKKKGTYSGLLEALSQAGITLSKFTSLWQVQSKYTYQEAFIAEDSTEFTLSKTMILPVDTDNFELYYRAYDEEDWTELNSDYVDFDNSSGDTIMTWIGDELSVDPIELSSGDEIRVIYQIAAVPSGAEQTLEEYIRTLPLMDLRDWRDQDYPIKNWNIRLIEEDDALFDSIIETLHPLSESIIFGKVRTEFPYSENIYNMEEYNGSTRDSIDPCDIDKDFIETCTSCRSSSFSIDIEIEDLSDNRILEALSIIEEFTPFHAVLHSINISGGINEFIQAPMETLEVLGTGRFEQIVLSGNAQLIFNRTMEEGLTNKAILRNMLADSTLVDSDTGDLFSQKIVIYCPDVDFTSLTIASDNVLQILSPHSKAGNYYIFDIQRNSAAIVGVSEPISPGSSFSFLLSNTIYSGSSASFIQDDVFKLYDDNISFDELGVRTDWDVENDDDYSGAAWEVLIAAYSGTPYTINKILPDGKIVLNDPSLTLPTTDTSGITYVLYDDDSNVIASSSTGKLAVTRRGKVDLSIDGAGDGVDDFRNLFRIGYYILKGSTQYKISGFVKGEVHEFYIDDYTDGAAAGQSVTIYERLVDNEVGYLDYKGLILSTSTDYEATLPIINGENATIITEGDNFKESYLIKINGSYYSIINIDGTNIFLNGPAVDVSSTAGAAVEFDMYQYTKQELTIEERKNHPTPGHTFDFVDRRGNEVIELETESASLLDGEISALALNASNSSNPTEFVSQGENISVSIEWK